MCNQRDVDGELAITLRVFRPEDQAAAKALILAGLAEHWGTLDLSLNPDLDDIAGTYAKGLFLVACCGTRIVGTGGLLLPEAEGSGQDARGPAERSGQDARGPAEGSGQDARGPAEGSGQDARGPAEGSGQDARGPAEGSGQDARGPAEARIVRMSVATAMRRHGIGRRILVELCEQARARGVRRLVLETTSTWEEVIAFYRAAGFRITHTQDGDTYFALDL